MRRRCAAKNLWRYKVLNLKRLIPITTLLFILFYCANIALSNVAETKEQGSDSTQATQAQTSKTEIKESTPQKHPKKDEVTPPTNEKDNTQKEEDDSWYKISTLVNSVATVILAILTGVYVFFTHRMLKETQESNDPAIDIDFEVINESIHKEVFLWVKNAGNSPAKNIMLDVEETLPLSHIYELKEAHLKDASLLQSGIPYLGGKGDVVL